MKFSVLTIILITASAPAVADTAIQWSDASKEKELGLFQIDGELSDQVYLERPHTWTAPDRRAPQYPEGFDPDGPVAENARLPENGLVRATDAFTRFNDEDAAYRISFHLSHYGGMPESAGDFNGDGMEDFMNMSHFAYVDNMTYAGEVHIWYGRPEPIDTRTELPDVVFYGEKAHGKLGISVASAGDFNGDGHDDIVMSAAFTSETADDGTVIKDAGSVYLVYGGQFADSRTPIQIDIAEVGKSIDGVAFRGGFDGSRMVGWANGLEHGDFNGDGNADLIIGSYDPYDSVSFEDMPARAYVIFGSRHEPKKLPDFRLGVSGQDGDITQTRIIFPEHRVTNASLSFGAAFIGDINDDGRDDIALTAGLDGENSQGKSYVFLGREAGLEPDKTIPVTDADIVVGVPSDPVVKTRENGTASILPRRMEQVRPVADFNCDGRPDFLVTARASFLSLDRGPMTQTGAAAIFFGREEWPAKLDLSEADAWIVNRHHGYIGQPAVERHVDLSGDGCADLLMNDPYFMESVGGDQQWRGRVWMVAGSDSPKDIYFVEDDAAVTFVANNRYPGMFGYTWQTGDWNGDGKFDVAIGDHYHGDRNLTEHSGVTFIFYNGIDFFPPE